MAAFLLRNTTLEDYFVMIFLFNSKMYLDHKLNKMITLEHTFRNYTQTQTSRFSLSNTKMPCKNFC